MTTQNFNTNHYVRATSLRKRWDISNMTLWRWIQAGKLPQPKYINGKRVWLQSDIEQAEIDLCVDTPDSPWQHKHEANS